MVDETIVRAHWPHRLKTKPVSMLTRVPYFEGTTAKFMGTLSTPARNVTPADRARATPPGVTFGPSPNSAPSLVRTPTSQLMLGMAPPWSRPPSSTTHSFRTVGPLSLL